MPSTKQPHLDDEGVAAAIAQVEDQLEQLKRHQAEATAPSDPPKVVAPTSAPVPQPAAVAATPAAPTQPPPVIYTPAAPTQPPSATHTPQSSQHHPSATFSTPAASGNGRPLPFQTSDFRTSNRRPRGEDTRGRMFYIYVCAAHRTLYCRTCGMYMSADEWQRSKDKCHRLDRI